MSEFENTLFVIVLYKRKIEDSQTYNSLVAEARKEDCTLNAYIHDNSPEPQNINSNESLNILVYDHDSSNSGVSRAYNNAAKYAKSNKIDWIVIFDQDTTLPPGALVEYKKSLDNSTAEDKIFAPILKDGDKVVSPCRYILHRGFHLNNVPSETVRLKDISFLNSGLVVNAEFLIHVGGFDEELFYYSDHDFFYRIPKFLDKVTLIDICLEHSLSSGVNEKSAATINRLKMLKLASARMSKKYGSLFPLMWFYFRCAKLVVLNRDISYLV